MSRKTTTRGQEEEKRQKKGARPRVLPDAGVGIEWVGGGDSVAQSVGVGVGGKLGNKWAPEHCLGAQGQR